MTNKEVKGTVNGIKYSIDESVVEQLKDMHNIDAIKEIEAALKQFKEVERQKDES